MTTCAPYLKEEPVCMLNISSHWSITYKHNFKSIYVHSTLKQVRMGIKICYSIIIRKTETWCLEKTSMKNTETCNRGLSFVQRLLKLTVNPDEKV